MPTTTILILTAVTAAFTLFAAVLAWAERQTHREVKSHANTAPRRRAF